MIEVDTEVVDEGCQQPVSTKPGDKRICGRPREYFFTKKIRDLGGPTGKHQWCASHRRLRRLHGADSDLTCREIGESCVEKSVRETEIRRAGN